MGQLETLKVLNALDTFMQAAAPGPLLNGVRSRERL